MVGKTTSGVHDVLDLQLNSDSAPCLEEVASSLNADKARIFDHVKRHLEHQTYHQGVACVSAVIENHYTCVSVMWEELWLSMPSCLKHSTGRQTGCMCCNCSNGTCNIQHCGGVTSHQLLQLPTEHKGKTTGYRRLAGAPLMGGSCKMFPTNIPPRLQ